jgi:hypothetical protein
MSSLSDDEALKWFENKGKKKCHKQVQEGKMKEYPIIFNGEMVRAILAGTKTQTRRIIKPQPFDLIKSWPANPKDGSEIKCPYGTVGDRLWVRENTRALPCGTGIYSADHTDIGEIRAGMCTFTDKGLARWWSKRSCPSIHMPRWASRITLEIVDIRVQRLQEISVEDVYAEGLVASADGTWGPLGRIGSIYGFADVWDSINIKRAPWSINPWVWCVSFRRIA